jgi:Regulator of ribonuclease activity B
MNNFQKLLLICALALLATAVGAQQPKDSTSKVEKIADALQSAKYLDHFFYFARQADADEAARRLRKRGWTVKPISKQENETKWWVEARQPGPLKNLDKVLDELEKLAKSLHGEYDGWEVPVAPEASK